MRFLEAIRRVCAETLLNLEYFRSRLIPVARSVEESDVNKVIVEFVVDVALPWATHTYAVRSQVTPEDVYALLTCAIGYFDLTKPHHYALVHGWWGPDMLGPLLANARWDSASPALGQLVAYTKQYLETTTLDSLVIYHWDEERGICCSGQHANGDNFFNNGIFDQPFYKSWPEILDIFAIVCRAVDAAETPYSFQRQSMPETPTVAPGD